MRRITSALALFCCVGLAAPTAALGIDAVAGPSASAAGVSGEQVVQYAERFLGYPYTTVGNSPSTGFSCIGFVSYVYQSLGINVPDDLWGAQAFAAPVAFSDLQPGDVLFFQNTVWSGLSHTAIYIGGGRFVHAEWYNRGVVESSFTNDPVDYNYWTEHYLGANRPWAGPASVSVATQAPAQQASVIQNTAVSTSQPAKVVPRLPAGPRARVQVAALNLRTRPGIHAYISAVIQRGTRVVILGGFNNWYRVALPSGATGWVVGQGIGKGATIPTAEAAPQVVARGPVSTTLRRASSVARRTAVPRLQVHGSVTVAVNDLRIHTAPSVSAGVIGSAGVSQRLGVVSRWNGWVKVRLASGQAGWISGLYTTGAAGARTTVARSRLPHATTRISTRRSATAGFRVGGNVRANQSVTVNVRQSPSTAASVLSILPPGGKYQVLGQSAGWIHARLASGVTGWISSVYLSSSSSSVASTAATAATTGARSEARSGSVVIAGVRLRAAPGLKAATIGLVAAGTHVKVLGTKAGWTKVRLPNKQIGYVFGSYVGS